MDTAPAIDLRSYGGELREHRHDHHQFVLALVGTLELETPAGARRADAATGVLIAADERHAFRARGPNRFAVVDMPGRTDRPVFERARREPAFAVSDGLRHHVASLAARRAEGPVAEPYRRHWAALLIDYVEQPTGARSAPSARFEAAAGYIERHCHRTLPLRELADHVHLSPARLSGLFYRHAGCAPREWIRAVRLDRAARLLATSDRPITDIALACGFSEHSALTRAFRRERGISPSAYRRRARAHRAGP